jgi:hypothetical protein
VILQPAWLSVALTSPTNGGIYADASAVTVAATASGNTIATNVQFFINGGLFAKFTNSPCTRILSNLVTGQYTLVAGATDDHGLNATSAPVVITMGPGDTQRPLLSIAAFNDALTLSWPAANGYFQLCTTTNLSPPVVWMVATNVPLFTNNHLVVSIPPAVGENRFYRLQSR